MQLSEALRHIPLYPMKMPKRVFFAVTANICLSTRKSLNQVLKRFIAHAIRERCHQKSSKKCQKGFPGPPPPFAWCDFSRRWLLCLNDVICALQQQHQSQCIDFSVNAYENHHCNVYEISFQLDKHVQIFALSQIFEKWTEMPQSARDICWLLAQRVIKCDAKLSVEGIKMLWCSQHPNTHSKAHYGVWVFPGKGCGLVAKIKTKYYACWTAPCCNILRWSGDAFCFASEPEAYCVAGVFVVSVASFG